MIVDTQDRSTAELLQEWRALAAKLRTTAIGSVYKDDAADGIDALCNACEDYEGRLTNLRELLDAERESADAQLSDAIADNNALRAVIMGDDPETPTALTPVGTLAVLLSMARDWAEKYQSEDEDPEATQEALNDAGWAIDRMYEVARGRDA